MFVIKKENLDETRIEKIDLENKNWSSMESAGKPATPDSGATQRVFVSGDSISTTPPARTPNPSRKRPTPEQRSSAAAARKKKEKITILSLCAVAAVLLIAVIIAIITTVGAPDDNGKIHNNVFAAGVNLSGKTPEEAKAALHAATDNTYTQLDMTIQVLDTTITLPAKDTGAKLDVDAVVEAAYDYGRGKDAQPGTHTVSILPYLTLDTDYIRNAVSELGKQYSTTLSQTTYTVEGSRPAANPDPEKVDTSKTYQTLTIQIGTAEYGLNTDRIYEQIMDAYNIGIFQVTGECSVVAPNELDCEALYAEVCTDPKDASIDPVTYVITPEVYGYGVALEELKAKVAEAPYGTTLTIPLRYLEPDITSSVISKDLFKDTLGTFLTNTSDNADFNANLALACKVLNGMIIKSGAEFSFNSAIGAPTTNKGYKSVSIYVGKSLTNVVGGGLSQVASTLYNCALQADLPIIERHAHSYAPSFVTAGLDAQVYYGQLDLRFTNNTEQPIRIEAVIENGALQISLIGTDTKTYTVDITTRVTKTKNPGKDYITLSASNPDGYEDGDVLTEGITGYTVKTYKTTYNESGRKLSEEVISEVSYAKRNAVIVKIEVPEISEPSEPSVEGDTEAPPDSENTP